MAHVAVYTMVLGGDAPGYDLARFDHGLKSCCALHKCDNQPRRDQSVYASKGEAEIQTAHDALRSELVLFAGHCSFPMLCLPVDITRETRIRSGGKQQKRT